MVHVRLKLIMLEAGKAVVIGLAFVNVFENSDSEMEPCYNCSNIGNNNIDEADGPELTAVEKHQEKFVDVIRGDHRFVNKDQLQEIAEMVLDRAVSYSLFPLVKVGPQNCPPPDMAILFPEFFACSVTPCMLTMTMLPDRKLVHVYYYLAHNRRSVLCNI